MVPHDFSAAARRAAELAMTEARVHGAGVLLLHVVELVPQFGPDTTLILPEGGDTPIGVHAYFRRRAEADLAQVARELAGPVAIRWIVREGSPADEILAVAREQPVDAIAMGTHGRTGLRHVLAGSVAERVVRESPVPVFTTRQPD
ncbi:MAG TPA: universal stress protein [Kofleriaceae bacterium]|nr:universal stress protein [Kofleriaceae bacterium]